MKLAGKYFRKWEGGAGVELGKGGIGVGSLGQD